MYSEVGVFGTTDLCYEAVTLRGVRVTDRTSRSNTPSFRQDMLISPEISGICALWYIEAVPPRGAGTVLVAACPMLLLVNTVSGRRSFHKQSPEFYI